ncbi:MAG: spore coat associated protein CotJA [Christensenellales bacterium]
MIIDNNPMTMYTDMNNACIPQETVIHDVQLANAYVPFEKMCDTYTPLAALKRGTAFPPLYEVSGWDKKGMGVKHYE